MFCVGVTLATTAPCGAGPAARSGRLALLPVATAVGTLAGAASPRRCSAAGRDRPRWPWARDSGYYSLSSIFIADLRGPELATIALLCNVMREIFTPKRPHRSWRAGATSGRRVDRRRDDADTTLPVITQAAGRPYAVEVSIFHGCAPDFSVPFLVTFFCTI